MKIQTGILINGTQSIAELAGKYHLDFSLKVSRFIDEVNTLMKLYSEQEKEVLEALGKEDPDSPGRYIISDDMVDECNLARAGLLEQEVEIKSDPITLELVQEEDRTLRAEGQPGIVVTPRLTSFLLEIEKAITPEKQEAA